MSFPGHDTLFTLLHLPCVVQPRKGCFEVRNGDGTKTYVSLLVSDYNGYTRYTLLVELCCLKVMPWRHSQAAKHCCRLQPYICAASCGCAMQCCPAISVIKGFMLCAYLVEPSIESGLLMRCPWSFSEWWNRAGFLAQDMPRPFKKLKDLDMDELAKEILASA